MNRIRSRSLDEYLPPRLGPRPTAAAPPSECNGRSGSLYARAYGAHRSLAGKRTRPLATASATLPLAASLPTSSNGEWPYAAA